MSLDLILPHVTTTRNNKDITTKVKSQCLYIIKIKYCNASGSGSPPWLIHTLRKLGILQYKQAKLAKHLQHSVHQDCSSCLDSNLAEGLLIHYRYGWVGGSENGNFLLLYVLKVSLCRGVGV